MLNPIYSIANNNISSTNRKLKILTCCTHEGFQTMLGETGHEFYMLSHPQLKTWDFHTRPLPRNHYIHALNTDQMVANIPYDLVLCQNRLQQYPILSDIAKRYHLPLIMLDHTEPPPRITKKQLKELQDQKSIFNVFITEHNKNSWGNPDNAIVIPHGINTDVFQGWKGGEQGLSVVNLFPQRDVFCGWNLWQEVVNKIPIKLVGHNPGLSKSVNNIQELVGEYQSCAFYLNTSQLSPIPLSLMEAMACGCPIVSTPKQEIPKIIKHGENGLLGETATELIEHCQFMLNNKEEAVRMGTSARQTILNQFSIQCFVERWNKVFEETLIHYNVNAI